MGFLVSYRNLGMSVGTQLLFKDLFLGLSKGDRVGLSGTNGSGKSTLIKIFAGIIQPDTGERTQIRGLRTSYLPQKDELDEKKTIDETFSELIVERFGDDTEQFKNARKIIGRANIPDTSVKIENLSGGWRKKIAITCVLLEQPDLLFLDEPTNHLDVEGIIWLESILKTASFSFVLISHDRALLNTVTNRMLELSPVYPGGFLEVAGGYEELVEKRQIFLETQLRSESILANKMRRESEWLSRSPKARATKAQHRIDTAAKLNDQLSTLRSRNRQNQEMDLSFSTTGRKTKRLIEGFHLSKKIDGRTLFKDLSFRLSPSDFVGLMGTNGSGKSTFLKLISGMVSPDSGSLKIVDGLRVLFFDQDRKKLNQDVSLKQALCPNGDTVIYENRPIHAISWGKRFLFKPEQMEMPVRNLSGGEQARILIAEMIRTPSDVLLLDEPTNDLDIQSIEVLEESLKSYPGAIIAASHDRYLINRLASRLLGFHPSEGASFYADFFQWFSHISEEGPSKASKKKKIKKEPGPDKTSQKFSYKHRYELEQIEDKIETAENRVSEIENSLATPDIVNNPEKLKDLCHELDEANKEVADLYTRWDYLETLKTSS